MTKAWRIVWTATVADAFTGEGARLFGGRWNSPGLPVVYASQHKSLAALEILVHLTPKSPRDFQAFALEWNDALTETLPLSLLENDWFKRAPELSTRPHGDAWLTEKRSAVLAVPSAIIPEENNYLLNPAHPDFRKIHIGKAMPFSLDSRLLA